MADGRVLATLGRDTLLVELGCGVGNAIFPLLQRLPELRVVAVPRSGLRAQSRKPAFARD